VNRTGGDDRGGFGVLLDGSVRSTVDRNIIRATGPGPGIYVAHLDAPTPPSNNRVIRNVTTSKNADGIRVDPDAAGTLLSRNLAVHSGDDGIDVRAPAPRSPGTPPSPTTTWVSRRSAASSTAAGTGPPVTATPPSAPTSPAGSRRPLVTTGTRISMRDDPSL
jgi:hypothetical protein